jgi:cyclase
VDEVTARVHVEIGFNGSNNGFLDAGNGELVLIDAPQLPTDAIRWAAEVARYGSPRYLINTDHHPDHTVGNRWLEGVVVAHSVTRQRLRDDPPSVDYLRDLFSVLDEEAAALLDGYSPRLPEVTFDDRLELWVGDREAQLFHAPAHTMNTIMVWIPEEGVLFTGDNVCEASLPAFVDSTIAGFFDAIDLAASLPFEHLVPGHGKVSGREILEHYRELGRELVGRVARMRESGATREECGAQIRYEDRIHSNIGPRLADYPAELVDTFQRGSVVKIYDELEQDPSLRER